MKEKRTLLILWCICYYSDLMCYKMILTFFYNSYWRRNNYSYPLSHILKSDDTTNIQMNGLIIYCLSRQFNFIFYFQYKHYKSLYTCLYQLYSFASKKQIITQVLAKHFLSAGYKTKLYHTFSFNLIIFKWTLLWEKNTSVWIKMFL